MGKRSESITPELQDFIEKQHIFFVGTAMTEGRVNISPKGMDSLRVLGPNKVIWLNLTGSGNETATHLQESSRMTLMFCAFEGKPQILRLYGNAITLHSGDSRFQKLMKHFPDIPGKRQVFEMEVDLVQSSCGFAVPLMDFQADRTILRDWAEQKGEEGIRDYWQEKNTVSLDGHQTGIPKDH
ncbi:pyridoxamine 5'-phosphate oxidase family protein [Fulvivirga sedimenti]|uniref:Pyridoxamine 5'-phosphate oxidase family protein n=1 Tax=Fulvivirga sedimenti TaxID=2879465 RepID=A0A9X1HQP7_9BACT|nr:pyridoxamine 5'-phosphate oxidase family protein [Fulvivirga sedimenti]MCA6074982.1 pyridoxamine 5'-phosphate oxidase family protein [Fulvivirga sedimenti]MCA6076159.1 pyridoxamine 5'-phosphate oxidase family protein [Fulvivirga sedimenti]MCA6077287.1 pyridoxamine 5'-phosphate oxidase family protein [Fulvivirga sedimenti]